MVYGLLRDFTNPITSAPLESLENNLSDCVGILLIVYVGGSILNEKM